MGFIRLHQMHGSYKTQFDEVFDKCFNFTFIFIIGHYK